MTEVIVVEELKQYIEKIERLEIEKAEVSTLIKEVYDAAKARGFDTKIMKQLIKLRKMDTDSLAVQDATLELYRSALDI